MSRPRQRGPGPTGVLFVLLLPIALAAAQVAERIDYQARLVDGWGPVGGERQMVFRLYEQKAGGAPIYEETQNIAVVDGRYTASLGTSPPHPGALSSALTSGQVWLEVSVDGVTLEPRERVVSVARALLTEGLMPGAATSDMLADDAVTSPAIAEGQVTSADLAGGAIHANHWAGDNAVSGMHIEDGTISSDDLAGGAVGGGALASTYQCGTYAVSNLRLSATFAVPYQGSFSVLFPQPFRSTPVVTTTVEVPDWPSGWEACAYVRSRSPTQFTGQVMLPQMSQVLDRDVRDASLGFGTSMAIVNGRPAVSYYHEETEELRYVRALDNEGRRWGSPVTVDANGNAGKFSSLAVINGRPAVSYYADPMDADLRYVRAGDADGTFWGLPIAVHTSGNVGFHTSLAEVNGRPAIAYGDMTDTNNRYLRYVRANDGDGASWGTYTMVDPSGSFQARVSMVVLPGTPSYPVIAYCGTDGLRYVRSVQPDGSTWSVPISLDGQVTHVSLQVVAGRPAIAYHRTPATGLWYLRSTDPVGLNWDTPRPIDAEGTSAHGCSLHEVSGRPAVAYCNNAENALEFAHARDANGATWNRSVVLDAHGGPSVSLLVVGGQPAVTYYDTDNAGLTYMRAGTPARESLVHWMAVEPSP